MDRRQRAEAERRRERDEWGAAVSAGLEFWPILLLIVVAMFGWLAINRLQRKGAPASEEAEIRR